MRSLAIPRPPTPVTTNGDTVKVPAPTVPSRDHGADNLVALNCQYQGVRVTTQEPLDGPAVVLPVSAFG